MHSAAVDESSGAFSAPRAVLDTPCASCGEHAVREQTWRSYCGGFIDYKYNCGSCDHVWWIDGIDS